MIVWEGKTLAALGLVMLAIALFILWVLAVCVIAGIKRLTRWIAVKRLYRRERKVNQ